MIQRKTFLIGFRGAGKTTLGERLAKELAWKFVDLDQELEKKCGPILDFVAQKGLKEFRQWEAKFLKEWMEKESDQSLLIATGGGVVDGEEAFRLLVETVAEKIFLDPPVEQLWERLRSDSGRLKIGDIKDFSALEALWFKRRPRFQQIATLRVDNQDITQALRCIAQHLAR